MKAEKRVRAYRGRISFGTFEDFGHFVFFLVAVKKRRRKFTELGR